MSWLHNRVGDLHLKLNDPGSAVQSYERAAELYAEQGFLNNAIALCGKILRVNPGRVQTYLRLAHLHARKNVVSESKRNLIEYLERMNTLGKLDEAFKQVKEFADQHGGNQDLRLMLVELLRAASRDDDAREQLERMAADPSFKLATQYWTSRGFVPWAVAVILAYAAKDRIKALKLSGKGKVRINQAGCLDRCDEGPVLVVYPEAVWYTYVDKSDIDEIIDEHLVHNRVVERLKI